jgi:hypothetical protein
MGAAEGSANLSHAAGRRATDSASRGPVGVTSPPSRNTDSAGCRPRGAVRHAGIGISE